MDDIDRARDLGASLWQRFADFVGDEVRDPQGVLLEEPSVTAERIGAHQRGGFPPAGECGVGGVHCPIDRVCICAGDVSQMTPISWGVHSQVRRSVLVHLVDNEGTDE
jgi:hypothetical protein